MAETDGAISAFFCVMLALYIIPAAIFTAYRVLQAPSKVLASRAFTVNAVALAFAIVAFWCCLTHLQNVDTSDVFDPYEILKISDSASVREIKKAYRKLGRELHPDKNLNNPNAHALFSRVVKAYEALTDPKGIENYRKYGHPDGPQSILMGFAFLSAFSGGGGGLFVLGYFGVVFAAIAFIVYSLHKSSGRRDRTQVSRRTATAFLEAFNERMSVHDIVELLLSCEEMTTTVGGEEDLAEAHQRAKAHDKVLKKMEAAKVLPADLLGRIKKHPHPIARENMIALYQFLRRNKLTGVPKPTWTELRLRKVLLELPYLVDIYATLVAENSVKRAYPSVTLVRTLGLLASISQGSFVADEEALRDQRARAADAGVELPRLALSNPKLFVADEANIQPGDWLTLELTITREHVATGERATLASTFFDQIDPKTEFRKEHLWLVVVDKHSSRVYAATKLKDLSQTVPSKLVFEGPGVAGKYEMEARVVCPVYFNAQASVTLPLVVESKK
ncbi:hypothetical protein Poli38472_007473 [Pythium oligandrum]|uniref:J domain-containing protein n=1 Tax=Pythium oligandrum TaxID=41045 RepID=A0A8K1FM33_PYTOL|nr:hypothetical protein Poli38472_007473 [Pythium oligandrum]|eukprot:TMW67801.1 hypothetical protein Poli38472_007473 [Pythium oligandrum]